MATGPRYKVPFRRRREGRTDYHFRYKLILSRKPRLVIRKGNRNINLQLIVAEPAGDRTLLTVNSRELKDLGYEQNTGNVPASYLAGLLFGKRMKAIGETEAILDMGIHANSKGNRIYSALKGVVDAGIEVPHSPEIFPDDARIRGENIEAYRGVEFTAQFEAVREKIQG
ncbi:50S ribosomal protein L18 [Methanocrinis sp.]|uniref:50S ribosomal protein L18 n=1 Tax=Methanocrinis sp. TaxID=3101522 RepID=UPI003D12D14B